MLSFQKLYRIRALAIVLANQQTFKIFLLFTVFIKISLKSAQKTNNSIKPRLKPAKVALLLALIVLLPKINKN